eukprot:93225_1
MAQPSPDDLEYISCLRQTANESIAASNFKYAMDALLEIKKLTPNDANLLVEIGDVCQRLDNYIGAKYYYEQAQRIDSADVEIYCKLALLWDHKLNKPLKAEKYYQSIFIIDPNNSLAYFNLAKLYIKQHRDDDAQIAFEKCLEFDVHNALYHNEYGKLLAKMDNLKEAEWELKQAMLMEDHNQTYHDDYARITAQMAQSIEGEANIPYDMHQMITKRWICTPQHLSAATSMNDSIKRKIAHKAQMLLCGFCRSVYSGVSMDMIACCFMYFISDYPSIVYDDTWSHWTDFGQMELEHLLFGLLCAGHKEQVQVLLVQLLDIMNSTMKGEGMDEDMYPFAAQYMSVLISSANVIELYRSLNETRSLDTVVDIACNMTQFDGMCNNLSFGVLIWKVLCAESDVLYLKYRMKVASNTIDKEDMLRKMDGSDLHELRLQDVRNIAMPLLFDGDTLDVVSMSCIGRIVGMAEMMKYGLRQGYKVCIYWMEIELKLIPKQRISDNVQLLLNNVMIQIWKRLNEDIKSAPFHYNILRVFMKKGISLKPLSVEWGEFYAIIAEIVLRDETLKSIVLNHCLEQLRNNMFPKTSWKQCIALLSGL